MAELVLQSRELRAMAEKPNLEALCEDIREAVNGLPVATGRRMALEALLLAFSGALRNSKAGDLPAEAADAFRNEHTIPKRVA